MTTDWQAPSQPPPGYHDDPCEGGPPLVSIDGHGGGRRHLGPASRPGRTRPQSTLTPPDRLSVRARGPSAASTLDTVASATDDPGREQPWAELGLKADEYPVDPRDPGASSHQLGAGDVLRHVERALLLQVLQGAPQAVQRGSPRRPPSATCSPASARTPACSTSVRATRSRSRSSHTTTRPSSSRSRAPRPASAASSATSSRWAPGRSR